MADLNTAAAPALGADIELMDLLGYVYLQNNRPDKAAVLLAARDVLAPDHPRTLLTLALAHMRAAKPARALDTLDRLALLGAMDGAFHLVRAQALQALGRTDEAAGAMRAFIALRGAEAAPAAGAPSAAARHSA
ncbi:hypothetical protein [Acidovorax sp.]|uniref:type III secretion apparatus assembly chaperone SctY n=1 Tax=Acidovorax sp. TaxID=1872122 RepID=UPI003CFBC94C